MIAPPQHKLSSLTRNIDILSKLYQECKKNF